ncbi:MAG TPA: xanthine dehydrogenase family protein molybdopterin-binding subunit [Opitutaceae bacterium]|nr:xanthine dehydrogenase family protein molybdopterin-binding subunit [Opitutaceae bacterium]
MAWPSETKYVGKPRSRAEAPAKVSGRARYSSDVAPPGLLYAAVVRSPWPAAKITSVSLDKARAAPGIKAAILARENLTQVRYYGEEIAAVAGVSRQAVLEALPLVEIKAEPLPFVVDEVEAMQPDAPRVFAENSNLNLDPVKKKGDVDAAFASAAAVVEGTFSVPVLIHNNLESFGGVVSWDHDGVTAWISTQGIFSARENLASHLGLPQSQVRVICDHMGGGFGAKTSPGVEAALAARLSREAGAPVRLMPNRAEQALAVGNRPSSAQKIKLAADRDGRLVAFEMLAFGTSGYAASASNAGGSSSANVPMPYIYVVPNTRVLQASIALNTGAGRPMRAPAHPQASFGMESIMDELAVKLGLDPVELRLRNDPFEIRQREWKLGAERFGWKEKYRAPGSSPGPVKVGVGCGAATWGGGGRGTQAEVQINPDGTVEVRCGSQDLGTGTRTVVQLVAAEVLQLDPARITARVGDTNFPPSGTSGGSTQTASVGPAVYDACEQALAELKKAGGLDDPRGTRWDEACRKLGAVPLVAHGKWREGLSSRDVGGVQFAEVEVDTETGFVRVRRILCVQDCGLVVNPLTCRNQANGGVIMGLGYALYEQRVMDRVNGVVLNNNLETYKLPGAADMPEIDVVFLDMPERGIIGMAEPVTIPTAAAIANAVANALGVRISSLPITPDKVLAALGKITEKNPIAGRERELADAFALMAAAGGNAKGSS